MAIRFIPAELGSAILVASLGVADAGIADSGSVLVHRVVAQTEGRTERSPHIEQRATAPTGDAFMRAQARRYRNATAALAALESGLGRLQSDLAALRRQRTVSDIQAKMDALDPASFPSEGAYVTALMNFEIEMRAAPSDSELARMRATKQAEIQARQAALGRLEADRDAAWNRLTGGRNLSDAALAVLRRKLAEE